MHSVCKWVVGTAVLVSGLAQSGLAGPIGTYYITGTGDSHGDATLDAIQGNSFVQNGGIGGIGYEGPIAVFQNPAVIRTTSDATGYSGGEYETVPNLNVTQVDTPNNGDVRYTQEFSQGGAYFDGTTDGRSNYTVNNDGGNVFATDTIWGGSGTLQFSTRETGDIGITYDARNNSLWIDNGLSVITDYTLRGVRISSFDTATTNDTALAMDVDHTLWYAQETSSTIYHYRTDGTFLGVRLTTGWCTPWVAKSAPHLPTTAVPLPSSLAIMLVTVPVAIGLCVLRRRRQKSVG